MTDDRFILDALLLNAFAHDAPVRAVPAPGSRIALMAGPLLLVGLFDSVAEARCWVEAQREKQREACPA